ncbi:TonB-dependent receptor [Methylophaga frappieri]|uniref:TonB-dependent receptor n=1 Tax=Methylophaga frappieri (strain ATCC BAA-2434 / DSM 25690 / JAM7) TaxID=754477 RepID=I1YEM2_METFJ|nr:TonB-dependent receptor [Methylophaga frappieri]AFJ01365.1 TonB-dependent receptor [Methylophaga frappieri]
MKKRFLTVAICACISAQAGAETQTSSSDDNRVQLSNITVQGEKQTRSLKETTSSVSVIDAEVLKTTQYRTLRDVITAVPNVLAPTGVVPNVRGVTGNGAAGGFNAVSGGASSRFTTLVDGVVQPFIADFTGDSGLWDIKQVEVFRGPQSTNNGRNSIAGAMYIETADPTFDWEGKVRLGYRNNERYFDKAIMLNGPIIEDTLAFRFAGQLIDGQTDTSNEPVASNPTSIDLNELDTMQGRAKLLWTPTDNLEFMFTHSRYDEEGDAGRRYFEDTQTEGYYKTFFRDMDTENVTNSLDVHYRLNEATSFDFQIAMVDYQFAFETYQANPAATQILDIDERSKTFDARINFGENNQSLNGFLGFAYYDRDQDIDSTGGSVYSGDDTTDSKAVYGEINFGLTERLILTAGLRYQDESQDRDFTFAGSPYNLKEDDSILLPKAALQYDLTEETRVGISATKGYNSGGGALSITNDDYYYFDEEEVNTYEVFARTSFDQNRYTLRANVFFNDFDGYQGQNAARRVVNVDKVETYGAEIEGTAWVTDSLEMRLGVGLLHTEIKKGGDEFAGLDGNELNDAPRRTANLAATYYVNENFDFGGNIHYTGGYYGDVDNTKAREISGFSLINLRANYRIGDLELSAFVNNITDKRARRLYEPANPPRTPVPYADFVEPRHVGISATYTFL